MTEKMSDRLKTVFSLIDLMSPEERERVRSKLASLRSISRETKAEASTEVVRSDVDDCIAELIKFLNEMGVMSAPPAASVISNFKGSAKGKSSISKFEALAVYMRKYVKGRLQRRSLLRIAYGILYEKVREHSTSITLPQMANRVDEIPGCLDDAFPGYARAGMLSMAVIQNRSFGAQYNGR